MASASVPPLSKTELQLDGGSMAGASLLPSQEENDVKYESENRTMKASRMEHHLREIAAIEDFASQFKVDEVSILPDLRQSLPPAVEALLSRLELSSHDDDPIRKLKSKDLRGPGFGTLFGGPQDPDFHDKFGQMPKEWAAGVRLLIMTAAGSCKTLEAVNLWELHLTIQELKAVLEPLQTSSVVRKLRISEDIVETKEGCKVVADFVKVIPSLRDFAIPVGKNSHILHYLATQGHPTLEALHLGSLALEEEDRADIIQACPKLKRMERPRWKVKDERTANMYAQVLIEHQSLCEVDVEGSAGPVLSLLLSACTGARSGTSLTHLSVSLTDRDPWLPRTVLQRVFLANRNLEHIDFYRVWTTSSEEWQVVFRSLKEDNALKYLKLRSCRFDEEEGFNVTAWRELVAVVKEGSKLEVLRIQKHGDFQHDLCPLIDVVTSDKTVLNFDLRNFQISSDESRSLASLMQKNRSLTSFTCWDLKGPINWEEILGSLRYNTTLKKLYIHRVQVGDQALKALLAALQVNMVLKVIRCYPWEAEGKDEIVKFAMQKKERQEAITYSFVSASHRDTTGVVRSLLQPNSVVRHLFLSFDGKDEFDAGAWEGLEALMGEGCTLESLTVFRTLQKGDGRRSEHDLRKLFRIITSNKSMRSLKLRNLQVSSDESEVLAGLIRENTSLNQLILHGIRGAHWEKLLTSLRYNRALRTVELRGIRTLDDGAFKELLGALEVNSSLQTIDLIDTNWNDEGKEAKVKVALEQKERRENYMATMRTRLAKDEFRVPTSGRLFLCGSPRAGKSQLRMALTHVARDGANRGSVLHTGVQKIRKIFGRTEGIEIELLSIHSLDISIWDLGGQEIFRALQDLLFPRLNLPCVFFLVFSPFDRETGLLKPTPSDILHQEFLPWLRFIASNSKITGHILPQVKFVISHVDKMENPQRMSWAKDVVHTLRMQFTGILDIESQIFPVNSKKSGRDIHSILDHIGTSFHYVLDNKMFKVPTTCLNLGKNLMTRAMHPKSRVKREPIFTTSAFYDICRKEENSLRGLDYNNEEDLQLLRAVAHYLHDTGSIIQFSKSDLVVVDPNWFTFSFMGRLIGAGQKFQNPLISVDRYTNQKDGLISHADFEKLLEDFAQILKREGYSTVEMEVLKKLMEEMEVCFPVQSQQARHYFAPVVFAEPKHKKSFEGKRQIPPWRGIAQIENMGSHGIFAGIRVQCRDRIRTTLTPAFFSNFQVYFRNHFLSTRRLRPDQIICDYNLMHIKFERYEIYIESDGYQGDHIDVLVCSTYTRSQTFKFIQQNVVKEIQSFCASSKGCPGVELVVGVLRTDSVENLTLSVYRDNNQSILITDLKERWREYILSKDLNDPTMWEEDTLANYHLWPILAQANLGEKYESARDLLTDEDFRDVLKSVKETAVSLGDQVNVLKGVQEEIQQRIKVRCDKVESGNKQRYVETSPQRSTTSLSQSPIVQSRGLQRVSSDVMTVAEMTLHEVQKVGRQVKELHKDFQEVANIIRDIQRDVKDVHHHQQDILEMMVNMNRQLDQLIGVTSSLGGLPSRPYLTASDMKWTHRISARVNLGRAMTLRFMCEERSGNHLVNNQPGYPITILKENVEVLRFLCTNSIRILWYLLKVGVHVASSLGNLIPDLEVGNQTVQLTAIAVGDIMTSIESREDANTIDSTNILDQGNIDSKVWDYLKHLFPQSLKDECASRFLLYRTRYITPPGNSGHVWLCRDCRERGKRMYIVD